MYNTKKEKNGKFRGLTTFSPLKLLVAIIVMATPILAQGDAGFDADAYIHKGFLIFLLFVIAMILIFLFAQNTTGEQEKAFLRRFITKGSSAKSEVDEEELLLDHNYDGIKELDNDLPPWWKYLFYFTIVFAVVYLIYYQVLDGPSQLDEYKEELAQAQVSGAAGGAPSITAENVKLLTDPAALAKGKEIFERSCAACHGKNGEGMVGPNLTDDYWIHGGKIGDIFKVITEGVLDKGMPSWKALISPEEIEEIASFIKSIHGTNPPNAKEPQGELFKDDAAAGGEGSANTAKSDSAAAGAKADSAAKK
ncbi:MAG: c-type cytochrome [Ignavibacteriales bacterium]|nr:MAG: c-type cytochrome [Ignavibacteriaceae bacterium]MBW7872302.1 c-type cytochrome [Ignavibacteria bacterium]MCZ2142585.1 c-type cytochrome [Ignavibacteriales bacterium]OQY72129.1 MAG: hypothetical protein B6D45_09430 [Ignavibacteriales bacterium UTCHB3]MBV6445551.1 hypothetical protein [Ignavibacteriaceae bacterium]